MRFPQSLVRGTLLRRYKRFLADVRLVDGEVTTVHVPNPGAMLGLAEPGLTVWLSRSTSATRKLPLTLEMVEAGTALVGVNTQLPNRLVAEALVQNSLPALGRPAEIRAEVRYGDASRVDFLVAAQGGARTWIEVKGVTLSREPGLAEWPDCVSTRATRHLRELAAKVREGDAAAVVFVVLRSDCGRLRAARDLDPNFATALDDALLAGVEVLAYGCDVTLDAITIEARTPIERTALLGPETSAYAMTADLGRRARSR